MLKFKKLILQNFMSYGNNPQEYEFETGITSIVGENGSGKSTPLVDALYYVLFNKSYRQLRLTDLVNDKNNKNLKVTLFFSRKNSNYMVERTYQSDCDIFIVSKEINGTFEPIPQDPRKASYQLQFEEDILGVNENYFELIVIKSMLKPISFISSTKQEKLGIVENIFSIQVFNFVEQIVRENIDAHKIQISNATEKIDILKTTLKVQQTQLIKMQEKQNEILQERLKEYDGYIDKKKEELKKYNDSIKIIDTYKEKLTKLNVKINGLSNSLGGLDKNIYKNEIKIKSSEDKMKIFEKYCGHCPIIEKIKKDEEIENRIEENKKLIEQKEVITEEIDTTKKDIENVVFYTSKEKSCISGINKVENEIEQLETKKQSLLTKETELIDISSLKELEAKINDMKELVDKLTEKNKYELMIKKLIDPMKFFLIKRWLPYFNQRLNEYLLLLNTNVNIIFDYKFDEKIKVNSKKERKYRSFSQGQKKRIDLSILFAFIDLSIKISNQSINLLVLDEIDQGLDAQGIELLLEILKEKSKELEVVFISHKVKINDDKLNRKFEVTMNNGYSFINKIDKQI